MHLKSDPLPTLAEMEAFVNEHNAGLKTEEEFVDFCKTLFKGWLNELPSEEFKRLWKDTPKMMAFLTEKYRLTFIKETNGISSNR